MSVLMEIPHQCPVAAPLDDSQQPDVFTLLGIVVFRYHDKYALKLHAFSCSAVTCEHQSPSWRRTEYVRARDLAEKLFDVFAEIPSDDIQPISWAEIADDVRSISHLAECPA